MRTQTLMSGDSVLAFAHIGDLHVTDAKQRNFTDFLSIVAQIEMQGAGTLDFVVLPGDNADNGRPGQYTLVATALRMLSLPVHIIPGDHDMEQGSLEAFYTGLGCDSLPKAVTTRGTRCLFLDISGPGGGGPDFRLGSDQIRWLERELRDAKLHHRQTIVFTHTYPDDLRGDGETEAMNRLLATHDVALVDLGHTHYNELANDGRTVFAATRSTGQIEEGPVGYSVATLDAGQVSWRFKPLDDAFPFVIITAPVDHRLLREGNALLERSCSVRALVLGRDPIRNVSCRTEDGTWTPMRQAAGERVWTAELAIPKDRLVTIEVQAVDATGRPGQHAIRAATASYVAPTRTRLGSDAASIGAWPENGIFGTQLGPNRNGASSS